ncbi:MAG: hypothetical protein IV093_13680 [Rubrivivax sp.]|nr:hypothetical protein [Rubrivivax sp.]
MTTPRTARFVSFALSLIMTLTIFSSVTSLSSPEHAGQLLVRVNSETPRV